MQNNLNKIWIDNDGCPNVIREMIYKTSSRLKISVVVVGNSAARVPESELIQSVVVRSGFDAADDYICEHIQRNDLLITSDVLLAQRIIANGAVAINSQGVLFNEQNIGERVATRNLMQEFRGSEGVKGGGPPPFGEKDKKKFAAILDQMTTKMARGKNLI